MSLRSTVVGVLGSLALFECGKCGETFETRAGARECEANHRIDLPEQLAERPEQ